MIYLILVLAVIVRLWSLDFGLPYFFHMDESSVTYTSFYAANNLMRPDSFAQPMLLKYILILIHGIYFLVGKALGFWVTLEQFYFAYIKDPTIFLLSGRLLNVFIGVGTVWFLYFVGQKVYSKAVGLMAAFFLSLAFIHVQESHYIKEDVLLGFLGLVIYYLCFLIIKNNRLKDYLLTGLFLGLAASLKYNSFIFLAIFMAAHFIRAYEKRSAKIFFDKRFYMTLLAAAMIFLLLNPYILIDYQKAFPEIAYQAKLTTSQWVSSEDLPVWLYYWTYHLRFGLGLPLWLLSTGGIFYLLFKKRRLSDLLVVIMPVAFFAAIAIFGSTNFARYAVIILPQMMLISAIICRDFVKSAAFLMIISFLVMIPPFLTVVKFNYYLGLPDTRILAKDWIEKNISSGTKIVNEGAIRSELFSVYGPPISMESNSLQRRLKKVKELGLAGTTLKGLIEVNKDKIGYDLIGTVSIDYFLDLNSLTYVKISGVEKYVEDGYCYLVTSSWTRRDLKGYSVEFTNSLETNYQLVKEFIPDYILENDPIWKVDFARLGKVDIKKGTKIVGPVIKIYRLLKNKCIVSII